MGRSTTGSVPRRRDASTKVAQSRLSVLELARELGNVAEACRQRGLDRTSFYEWKRRFQMQGFEGLKDLPPIHKSHPQATPEPVVARIRALALEHPAFGCNRIEALLALEGRRVSAITIQKILNDNGLGTRHERWLALERRNAEEPIGPTPEQAAFLERLNPCFRERHVESSRPGELLSPRAAAPGLPQPGPPAVGDGRTFCQTRRLRGHIMAGIAGSGTAIPRGRSATACPRRA